MNDKNKRILVALNAILDFETIEEMEEVANLAIHLINEHRAFAAMPKSQKTTLYLKKGEVLQNIGGCAYIMSRSVGGMGGRMVSENYDDVEARQDRRSEVRYKRHAVANIFFSNIRRLESLMLWEITPVKFVMNPLAGSQS